MKYLFMIFSLMLILNINLVISLESSTPLICGGNEEVVIACLGSEELTFFGLDVPEEGVWSVTGEGAEETHTEPEPIPPLVLEPFLLFGIIDISFLRGIGLGPEDLWLIYGFLIICIFCIFLWLRKRKCDKCRKRFRYKDLTKKEEKYYCEKCLEEMKNKD